MGKCREGNIFNELGKEIFIFRFSGQISVFILLLVCVEFNYICSHGKELKFVVSVNETLSLNINEIIILSLAYLFNRILFEKIKN